MLLVEFAQEGSLLAIEHKISTSRLSFKMINKYVKAIDAAVDHKLKLRKIMRSKPLDDHTFLRRTYLDLLGRIPSLQEVVDFSKQDGKRELIIDKLIASEGYVSHQFNILADMLRATSVLNGAFYGDNYINFIKNAIRKNKPYDEFVHDILSSKGAIYDPDNGGSGFMARDKGMPLDHFSITMQTFLSANMTCAQCHDDPFSQWKQSDFFSAAAFNSGVVVRSNLLKFPKLRKFKNQNITDTQTATLAKAVFMSYIGSIDHDGTGLIRLPGNYIGNLDDDRQPYRPHQLLKAKVPFGHHVHLNYSKKNIQSELKSKDMGRVPGVKNNSRVKFADWLTSKSNPMFTKSIVNRLWNQYMGRPLIGPITDLDQKDKGVNPRLTSVLTGIMEKCKYDIQAFTRIVMRTRTYQSAVIDKGLESDYFSGMVLKRLSAEQLWDSLITLAVGPQIDEDAHVPSIGTLIYSKVKDLSSEEIIDFINEYRDFSIHGLKKKLNKEIRKLKNHENNVEVIKHKNSPVLSRKMGNADRLLARASNLVSPAPASHFLKIFGQSNRTITDDANRESSITQILGMVNGMVDELLINRSSFIHQEISTIDSLSIRIDCLFLSMLTRMPTSTERSFYQELMKNNSTGIDDAIWVLANSHEFLFRS
jgi:hypothetical protein